jgi:hypothetical protein
MRIFKIDDDDQDQFAELPEIAMDLNFGRSGSNFYLVISCRMAVLLNETTFTEPEDTFFLPGVNERLSPEARTRTFMDWFNDLPSLGNVTTATPLQAWVPFMGAIGPVTPIGALPSPPPPPPSVYGHLPFKAKTLADTVIYRWEAYPTSRRINITAKTTRRTLTPRLRQRFLSRRPDLRLWRVLRCRTSCPLATATNCSPTPTQTLSAVRRFRYTASPAAELKSNSSNRRTTDALSQIRSFCRHYSPIDPIY